MDIGSWLDGNWRCNRIEQSCIEDRTLIEIFGMIWQARNSGFAESLQLVWFPERLRRVFYLLTNARALRLGEIFRCLHTADPNRCVGVNRQRSSVRENHMVEGHVRSLGRREIPAQESPSPLAQRRSRYGRDMSLDRRSLGDSEDSSDVYRFHSSRGNW